MLTPKGVFSFYPARPLKSLLTTPSLTVPPLPFHPPPDPPDPPGADQ
jgi:hypothetical protein